MPMSKPQELAVLEVNGKKFEDWESVWVQMRRAESFHFFRFTAAERDPIFNQSGIFPLIEKLQFKPGYRCNITLAGQPAILNGRIETRQVAYDSNSHGVQLIGKSNTAAAARSSVDHKTGNFDKKNIVQVAQEVCKPYGVTVKVIGSPDLTKFDKLQCEVGELVWDFLERIARPRGVIMGSDKEGNFLLIGKHQGTVVSNLIEGVNIKACQCVISHKDPYETYDVRASHAASDDNDGTAASELHATTKGSVAKDKSKIIVAAEQPVKTQAEVQARVENEKRWREGTVISATIIVQGWLRDGAELWEPGDQVHVKSPMAMLDENLTIQTATFTQDNASGTQTSLDLVNPAAMQQEGEKFNTG
jgi:prophage tail gpP-like protein